MPKYAYKCNTCLESFVVVHGMSEEHEACGFCYSKAIHRIPQMLTKGPQGTSKGSKVGDEVKRAIEENRAVLKEEKKKRAELPDEY
tara:strand:+ start:2728 stop:2985 length:258 start_codon:yes stop_codon:yes gene_type:complete